MNDSKFPKLLDYQALKQQYGDEADLLIDSSSQENNALNFEQERAEKKLGLHGSRLRSYAFAVLTRKEYSKVELIEKLALYAESRDEVISLVEELSAQHYQSDQRVAEMMLSSQKRKGKGPNQIKIKLKNKKVDSALIAEELKETDWAEQAYQLKVKKYGLDVTKDQKLKAKQMRFLMYRGFEMDAIIKAISRKPNED